jgi:hypothetical protein
MNMDDIFSQFAIFSEAVLVVSEAVEAEAFVAKGSNLRIKVKTLEEIANGVKTQFKHQEFHHAMRVTYILGRMQSAPHVQLVVVQVKY